MSTDDDTQTYISLKMAEEKERKHFVEHGTHKMNEYTIYVHVVARASGIGI